MGVTAEYDEGQESVHPKEVCVTVRRDGVGRIVVEANRDSVTLTKVGPGIEASETKMTPQEWFGFLSSAASLTEERDRLKELLQDVLDAVAIFPKISDKSNFETVMIEFGWMKGASEALAKEPK